MTDPSASPQESAKTTIDPNDLVAESESGARVLSGGTGMFVAGLCIAWSAFQLYIASDVPFWLQEHLGSSISFNFVFNNVLILLAYNRKKFSIAFSELFIRNKGVVFESTFKFIQDHKRIDTICFF